MFPLDSDADLSTTPQKRRRLRSRCEDAGMATAEYAVATVAACGFAAVLLAIVRSDEVKAMLVDIIKRALTMA